MKLIEEENVGDNTASQRETALVAGKMAFPIRILIPLALVALHC